MTDGRVYIPGSLVSGSVTPQFAASVNVGNARIEGLTPADTTGDARRYVWEQQIASAPVGSGQYYVDYASGADTNAGTSASAPWKHCPGDTNATGNAAACVLVAGDVVNFKGGVVYRGQIVCNRSGASGSPITYKTGAGWGTGAAVIDGADVWSPTWTQCTSAAECGGNANYANLWWVTAPSGFTIFTPLYEDGEFVWFAQDPNPVERIFYDRYQDFREIPLNDSNYELTRTSLKDVGYFTQTDASYWDGAYALIWRVTDTVTPVPVSTFDPATHTITFPDVGGAIYTNRSSWFSMVGHVALINTPGEFGLYDGKLFLWPSNSDNPTSHVYSVSARKNCFYTNGCSYVTIDGLEIRGAHGLLGESNEGIGIRGHSAAHHVTISNNEIYNIRSMEKKGAIYIEECANFNVIDNYIHHCQKNQGVLVYDGDRIYCDRNTIEYVGYHGVMLQYATNSRVTAGLIQNLRGTHAVGISVYEYSENVLIANNRILVGSSNPPYGMQRSKNVWTIGNLMDGFDASKVFTEYTGMSGTNYALNNTLVRALVNVALDVTIGSTDTNIYINNIIDGGAAAQRSYNLYTGLSWNQTSQYDWYLGTGETLNMDVASIFVDYTNGDFRLKANSPAINAGTDVSAYYPTALFPDFDFTKDLTGATRSGFDLGAYGYATDPENPTMGWLPLGTASGILVLGVAA